MKSRAASQLNRAVFHMGWISVIALALSACGKSENEKMKDQFVESRQSEAEYLAQERIEEFSNKRLLDVPRPDLQPPQYQPSTVATPKYDLPNLDELQNQQERKEIKSQLDRIERKQRELEMRELARSSRESVTKGLGEQ
jgi:hypothetical protein